MQQKLFKIIQETHTGKVLETVPTPHLNNLKYQLEKLKQKHPKDTFSIVDTDGNPLQSIDEIAADLAHPVAKAKRKKAATAAQTKEDIKKRLTRCV